MSPRIPLPGATSPAASLLASLLTALALTLVALGVGLGASAAWAQSAAGEATPRIGQVALSVGQAYRVGADGQRVPVRIGDALHEQDRLVTGQDALLMIVFVDQARLSLRPDTEVFIRRYRVDPSGADTRLDMELVRGTVRQISGEAARRQPERYRLNTPIATIGVRGTDFLARASAGKTETYVHEGMIVVLPPADQCRSDCPILASSSAGDAGRYLQVFSGGVIERAHVPPEDVERLFGIRAATARDRDASREGSLGRNVATAQTVGSGHPLPPIMPLIFTDPQAGGSRLSDSRAGATSGSPGSGSSSSTGSGTGTGTGAGAGSGASQGGASPGGATAGTGADATPSGGGTTVATGGSATGTGSTGGTPTSPVVPPAPATPLFVSADITLVPLPTTLVWGRFSEPLQIPVTITLPYDEVRQGRHVTVGELTQYALWRNDPRGTLMPALTGQATFALAAAQSFYRTTAGNEMATVTSARLTADFDLARFATELSLRTASGISTVLNASGRINDEGIFLSLAADGSQRVAGAFSRNGAEAGYLFNKVVGSGVFQGITLWGIRP